MLFLRNTHRDGVYRKELWPIDRMMSLDARLILQFFDPTQPQHAGQIRARVEHYAADFPETAEQPWTRLRILKAMNELFSLSAISPFPDASAHCDASGDAA